MLSNIGTTLVVFTLFISFFIINASFVDLKNTNKLVSKKLYKFSLLQSTFIIVAFFTL